MPTMTQRPVVSRTVDPTTEPVTLRDVKQHSRITVDEGGDDRYVELRLIPAAREFLEAFSGRQFITATYTWKAPGWPNPRVIILSHPPIQSVTSITYVDTAGDTQTLASTEYLLNTDSEPGRITEAYNKIWPVVRLQDNAITVTYVAGYGAASAVPERMKLAMSVIVNHWYDDRSRVGKINDEVENAVYSLLWGDRVMAF